MNRRPPFRALPLFLAAALALPFAGCAKRAAETNVAEEPIPVRVAPVEIAPASVPVVATGTLGPKEDVNLSFKIGGVVARVLVDEGAAVTAGQPLASLDFGEIDPAVTRARAAAEKAARDLERAQRLYADSVATLEQVQNAESANEAAQAELRSAEFNRRHAEIVAPSSGVILRRLAEPGELVESGRTILVFGSRARGQVVRAWLADRDVVRVRRGDRATVRFDAIPGLAFEGRVAEIAAAADPMTGTYRVEIALDAKDLARGGARGAGGPILASGLVGAVEIRPSTNGEVSLVPAEALLEADGTQGIVYTVDAAKRRARRLPVTVAYIAGDRIAIAAGLDGVRSVVTDGAAYLDDGHAVEIRP